MIDPRRYKNIFSRMGEILVDKGYINQKGLNKALNYQKEQDIKLGEALVDLDFISKKNLMKELANQLNVGIFFEDQIYNIDTDVVSRVPQDIAEENGILPVDYDEGSNTIKIATENPQNIIYMENLKKQLNMNIKPLLADEQTIEKGIEQLYSEIQKVKQIQKDTNMDLDIDTEEEEEITAEELSFSDDESAPAIKFVNYLLLEGINKRATDIHIEPFKNTLKVRFRIDGVLQEIVTPPKKLQSSIVSRIKIISNIDIAEKRVPHDGRFSFKYQGQSVDIRVSTLPTNYGEKVVMRLLYKSEALLDINKLGIPSQSFSDFVEMINKPYGIILVSGPTGSGKTTTLYAVLNEVISSENNIVTIEDPIEYDINMVNQVQVNKKAGLTFAKGLRSILRQDPDIIMIGEIRDQETAEIAIRAALTGHLVLSTIHANDASTTITRLIDMGIPPFLVGSSLLMVIAQRLVRKICDNCKHSYVPDDNIIEKYGLEKDTVLYEGKSCNNCIDGYHGRTGIFEILPVKREVRKKIYKDIDADELRKFIRNNGIESMRHDGFNKALGGITTLEEVFSITISED